MTRNTKTKNLVLMGIMTAIIFLMGLTPIGYVKTGTLSIALITIPVAIAAYALGPVGGTVAGLAFGTTSAIMAFTAPSPLMVALTADSPVKVVVLCVVPRALVGLCAGTIGYFMRKAKLPSAFAGGATGFSVAFLNTVFFMSSILFLFGNTETVQSMKGHENLLIFVFAVVSVNVVIEWISCTVITSGVAAALSAARLIDVPKSKAAAQ
ncbi:ECF transporter S component [Ruminococcus sp.]|uniref:ECF transporter S component n=1 Tax=Ruminococcus sp. TaxID=41978 RepID=UPI0025F3C17F|nr:ECF transporter S component [Ruminococcus sp.]MBQ8965930.1 ECF transporter S component [Ruminococcus sp.]